MRPHRTFVVVAVAALVLLGFAGTAQADSGSGRNRAAVVEMQDQCDPATFNAALSDPHHPEVVPCVGDGDTTFQEFLAEFAAEGSVDDWQFDSDHLTIRSGQSVKAVNQGGEAHSFTEVKKFGPGCVPPLNQPGENPPAICGTAAFPNSIVAPGGHLVVSNLMRGTHKFECLIHPWMRTVVTVR